MCLHHFGIPLLSTVAPSPIPTFYSFINVVPSFTLCSLDGISLALHKQQTNHFPHMPSSSPHNDG